MGFPYTEVFLALLLAYMVYSVWAKLDGRYPIAAALVLLVITAVVDALGFTASANTLAEFVFFLLGAGVVLLLVDHVREGRGTPQPSAAEAGVPTPGARGPQAEVEAPAGLEPAPAPYEEKTHLPEREPWREDDGR